MKWFSAWIAGLVLVTFVAGCDWGTSAGPQSARLRIEGQAPAIDLIVSKRFLVSRFNGEWQLSSVLDADTLRVQLPFDKTYDISQDQRFLARIPNVRAGDQLRVRGWIDGQQRYAQSSTTLPADSTLQVLYVFGNGGSIGGGGKL